VEQRTIELTFVNKALHAEVGERARAECELKTQEERLRLYARELERSNRELEQFASVASHDLQEPLRKIQAFVDRLRSQFTHGLPEQAADYLARMLAAAGRMRALIDDLLTYSRIARKGRSFAPVDLGEVARDVVSDLDGRLQMSGGRIEIGPLPTVDADKVQMRQLLQNLIANALKFRKPEEAPEVHIAGRLNGAPGAAESMWEIEVRDNGIGFENQYRDRIFNMFERLHGRNEYEGTGIGQAICRRIVERHNGTIVAESAPGEGTTFQIHLPMHQPSTGENREELAQADHHTDG
jgi:light-regulated signal transduction histidine kinase (bacteriophytochrome)